MGNTITVGKVTPVRVFGRTAEDAYKSFETDYLAPLSMTLSHVDELKTKHDKIIQGGPTNAEQLIDICETLLLHRLILIGNLKLSSHEAGYQIEGVLAFVPFDNEHQETTRQRLSQLRAKMFNRSILIDLLTPRYHLWQEGFLFKQVSYHKWNADLNDV